MTDTKRMSIEDNADLLYSAYCKAVGGVAFNGDPLPEWTEFAADPSKQKQADAWRSAALRPYDLEGSFDTARELLECAANNIANLMHYAVGKPDHVPLSGYALQIRDVMLQVHHDKRDIELQWEQLTRALGAHGDDSDPLFGSDTNEDIQERAMERIRDLIANS